MSTPKLKGWKKIQYILDYYKLPLILAGILLYSILWLTNRNLTQKENVLYVGLVNAAPSEELCGKLSDGYLEEAGYSKSDHALYLYRNLYLTTDETSEYHAYSYATKLKILGAIEARQLDAVLMNKEAFDAFSQNGYLVDLKELLRSAQVRDRVPELYVRIENALQKNIRIEEDNSLDVMLGNENVYQSVTSEGIFGMDLTAASSLIRQEELSGTIYFGILANSPRQEEAIHYLDYLTWK